MADETNGQGKARLDRLEGLMELLIDDHLKFRDDLRQLLTAQVLLTDRMDKLTVRLDKLAETVQQLAETQREAQKLMDQTMQELADSQKHTDSRLNALIHVVDDWITRGIPPPPRQ